jgi:hypothetical protein
MTRLIQSILISSIFLITACGGGGGGDDTTSIAYTGLTTPAVITAGNAEVLAKGVFGADIDALGTTQVFGVATQESEEDSSSPANITLTQILANTVRQIDFTDAISLPGVVQTVTNTDQCDSGSVFTSITVDDVTGDFHGYMTFQDCVTMDVYLDGTVNFDGTIDTTNLDNIQMTMVFSSLVQRYGSESYTYSGQIAMTATSTTLTEVVNFYAKDNNTQKVYWYANYRIEIVDTLADMTMRITGRFYNPDYGYISVTTPNIMRMNYTDDWPYTGIVVASGDNSSLMIDCEGDSILTYTLSVDADGDGIYETVTIENW